METNQIFLLVALVATGLFLVQFVMSVFFGNVDVDVDSDAQSDMDMSSIVSYKGLIHFGMGFGWAMYLADSTDWKSYLFATLAGLAFIYVLWLLYKAVYKLQKDTVNEPAESLVGRSATIYLNMRGGKYRVQIKRDGALREVDVASETGHADYVTGDVVTITAYKNNILYIN